MVKYRVTVDKEACIGDGICISICPEIFEFDDEGKARIVKKYREEGKEYMGLIDVTEDLENCLTQAEAMCPTQAIKLFKLE